MRIAAEILVIGALVILTWSQSLQERWGNWFGGPKTVPAPAPVSVVQYVAQPTPAPTGDWMWDPRRRSNLDRPAYASQDGNASSWFWDSASGRKYWLDAKGVPHYEK